jgi:hypothetical protein
MGSATEQADQVHGASGEDAQIASGETEALVTVRLNPAIHRINDFVCTRSARVQGFFGTEYPRFVERNYCRVFILPNPDDPTHIWGFYTLSPGLVEKDEITKQHQKRAMPGLPIPMARIGFLGRDDSVPKQLSLGGVLIHDAALRVQRCEDMTAWGLYLDADNAELATWYAKYGFKATVSDALVMYAPLRALLPQSK